MNIKMPGRSVQPWVVTHASPIEYTTSASNKRRDTRPAASWVSHRSRLHHATTSLRLIDSPMRDFFRGRRRMAGVVLLVVALGLMGAWIRSKSSDDALRFTAFARRNLVRSERDQITWWAWDVMDGDQSLPSWSRQPLWQPPNTEIAPGFFNGSPFRAFPHHDYLDAWLFSSAVDRRVGEWKVAYWVLVLPLTVLSASLILWPQRTPPHAASTITNPRQ
jgi:hypothetical protein